MTHGKYELLALVVVTPGRNVQGDNVHKSGAGHRGVVQCIAAKKPQRLSSEAQPTRLNDSLCMHIRENKEDNDYFRFKMLTVSSSPSY